MPPRQLPSTGAGSSEGPQGPVSRFWTGRPWAGGSTMPGGVQLASRRHKLVMGKPRARLREPHSPQRNEFFQDCVIVSATGPGAGAIARSLITNFQHQICGLGQVRTVSAVSIDPHCIRTICPVRPTDSRTPTDRCPTTGIHG